MGYGPDDVTVGRDHLVHGGAHILTIRRVDVHEFEVQALFLGHLDHGFRYRLGPEAVLGDHAHFMFYRKSLDQIDKGLTIFRCRRPDVKNPLISLGPDFVGIPGIR